MGWGVKNNRVKIFFGTVLVTIFLTTGVRAQNLITVKTLNEIVGTPLKVEGQGSSLETWYYGESKVFVREDKVVGWTDNGELAKLGSLPAKKVTAETESGENESWPNAWTAPEIRQKDVIRDVIP